MLTLLFTCFLTLPLYPLNPVEQDTLAMMNLHVTAGFNAPNRFGSISPELTGKYEMLFKHPFVVRAACDYRYGTVSSAWQSAQCDRVTRGVVLSRHEYSHRLCGTRSAGGIQLPESFDTLGRLATGESRHYRREDQTVTGLPPDDWIALSPGLLARVKCLATSPHLRLYQPVFAHLVF